METINIKQVIKAVKGTAFNMENENISISSVITDSRVKSENGLFVPLKGENFDGHDFIKSAVANGSVASLSEKKLNLNIPYILVEDTMTALGDLAEDYLKGLNPYKIAITGSTGKTSTKDMLASAFSREFTLATKGNTNNLIGVPMNIFNCGKNIEYLILEMGMNKSGELKRLSDIVKPSAVIITAINNSHIGNFDDFDSLIKAKMEILSNADADTKILVNGDDPYIMKFLPQGIKYSTFGIKNENDYYPDTIEMLQTESIIHIDNEIFTVKFPGIGAVCSFLAVYGFLKTHSFIDMDIKRGLELFTPPQNRMNILNLSKFTVIDDSYNASPSSMKNGIDVLSRFSSRKVAILSDMYELGNLTEKLHREIGEYLNEKNIDVLITTGTHSKIYNEIFNKEKHHFSNRDKLMSEFQNILHEDDVILIKGSHSTKMDEIVKYLKEKTDVI